MLRFYQWDRPSVSIGYVQQASAAPAGFSCVRRPTGGGVVFHDHDFTYSVVLPAGHWLTGLDRLQSYDWLNRSVQSGLKRLELPAALATQDIPHGVDRLTMVCFKNPTRYDILLSGQKVAGSAQRRTKTGILHQGSIHFGGPLPVSREALGEAVLAGFREILGIYFRTFDPPAELLETAAGLVTTRYATPAWNHRR